MSNLHSVQIDFVRVLFAWVLPNSDHCDHQLSRSSHVVLSYSFRLHPSLPLLCVSNFTFLVVYN